MEDISYSPKPRDHGPIDDAVPWKDLREWIELIDDRGFLKRIRVPVDLDEELSAITFMATRAETAPALLFETISNGAPGMSVLSNMLGASAGRYAVAMGLDEKLSTRELITATRARMRRRISPKVIPKEDAPVNQVLLTGADVDVTRFPSPKFWPGDGGRYIGTGDVTFTRDPVTGRINVGVYRQMIQGPSRVAIYCSPGKHGRLDREAWWARGKPCEVVAAYGVDPVLFMVGAQSFASNESELDVAGGLMSRPVELTEAEFVSLPIPAAAEIVIEGFAHPGESEEEGPLGELTGYYGRERGPQPVIEVKAVHHR